MAKCDEGYLCEVCGEPVESITGSDLYLRYVIGEIDSRALLSSPERHIHCNPTLAQFVRDERFPEVFVSGPFAKEHLDEGEVQRRTDRVPGGGHRLKEARLPNLPINDYPLPDARRSAAGGVVGGGGGGAHCAGGLVAGRDFPRDDQSHPRADAARLAGASGITMQVQAKSEGG